MGFGLTRSISKVTCANLEDTIGPIMGLADTRMGTSMECFNSEWHIHLVHSFSCARFDEQGNTTMYVSGIARGGC